MGTCKRAPGIEPTSLALAGNRKVRETRDQIANIHWIIEKGKEFQKNIYFCFIEIGRAHV